MKPSARKQIIEDAFINLSKKYNLEYMHGFIANKPLLSGKIETLTIKIEDTFDMENKDIIRIRINAPNNFPYSFILYSGKSLHSFYVSLN
jgi:hypothetical protein